MKEILLKAYGLEKSFYKKMWFFKDLYKKKVLFPMNFNVYRKEILGIVGESGSGKTTLANILVNLIKPDNGMLIYKAPEAILEKLDNYFNKGNFSNTDIEKIRKKYDLVYKKFLSRRDLKGKIQLIFQTPYFSFNPKLTIYDSLMEPCIIHNVDNYEDEIIGLIDLVGIDKELLKRYPYEVSGGQLQRLAIARALILKPELLIADEPISSLDLSVQAQIINLLRKLNKKLDLTLIVISHDLAIIRQLCDRVLVMYKGKMVECGDVEEVFDKPIHPYTFSLIEGAKCLETKEQGLSFKRSMKKRDTGKIGCIYYEYCVKAGTVCEQIDPPITLIKNSHQVACHMVTGQD